MSITMEFIYKTYKEPFSLTLLAGEEGMNRTVSWVYYSEDRETTSFLYGNELIITTGIFSNTLNWLLLFCKSLVENHASGLIVNTGMYIHSISEDVIEYCRSKHFPLLCMPWNIHIIDVSRGICGKIQEEEKTEFILSSAFHNAIFYPDAKHMYESILIQQGFLPEDFYYVVCVQSNLVHLVNMWEKQNEQSQYQGMKVCAIQGNDEMVLIFCGCTESNIKEILKIWFNNINKQYKNKLDIHVGIGCRVKSFYELSNSYEKANVCALQACRQKIPMLCFSDLGLQKILLCVHDRHLLQNMIDETIRPIIEYDRTHHTEYLKVLRMYIETDSGIQEIANTLFMHRNTINYRISKIKDILQKDLSSMKEKVLFQTAFYILDLYGPEPEKSMD